uniref:V-SNARE coiled-coil homology domain-containing protein n=1 Tax=Arcella intermedia TaxID=1963864 RepID=A0A6B2LEZ5_9EUKA
MYACVANRQILAYYSKRQGNFTKVVNSILEQIPTQDNKMSYAFEKHYFHYIVSDGVTYLCIADEGFGRRIPFAFLDDIKGRFLATYRDRGKTASPNEMQYDFSRILQTQMEYYSKNENADKIMQLRKDLDDVQKIMVKNIDKVLERGQKIELLVEQTEQLTSSSFQFKKKSTELKRVMWWKNAKLMVIIVVFIIILIYVIVAVACGGPLLDKCVHGSPAPSPTPSPPLPPSPPSPPSPPVSPAPAPSPA